MREGAPHAAEEAASLGQLYRNILKTEAIIPMGRELDITAQYLDLMGFLYGEQVLYHMDLDPALRDMPASKRGVV
jgi:sensor histidine kinase YesM